VGVKELRKAAATTAFFDLDAVGSHYLIRTAKPLAGWLGTATHPLQRIKDI